MKALTEKQVEQYENDGFLVVEDMFSPEEVAELSAVTDHFASMVTSAPTHPALDIGQTEGGPYLRRVKSPHRHHPVYTAAMRKERLLDVLEDLLGPDIRLYGTKINLKLPSGTGDAIQWHQDWGFYPHTNDSLVAVGVLIDAMTEENGPLLVVPGSHKGEVFSHNVDGRFAGAIDFTKISHLTGKAEVITAPAGSITLHHVRAVHASGPNLSSGSRRLMFQNYAAADAWPLVGCGAPGDRHLCAGKSWDEYQSMLVRGQDREIRLENVAVKLPLPQAMDSASVFTTQSTAGKSFFASSMMG
jgi:ectoine hydroxylase-related dioxygenase (phytanoyl-CoA dioxygenase family)